MWRRGSSATHGSTCCSNLIKTYFKLEPGEEESFHQVAFETGVSGGIRNGAYMVRRNDGEMGGSSGLIEGKRETLKHLLTKKFGTIPEKTMARIEALDSLEELDTYLDRVLTAETLEDMGLDGR